MEGIIARATFQAVSMLLGLLDLLRYILKWFSWALVLN